MRLTNRTKIPDERIREIIRFVRPNNTPINEVIVGNTLYGGKGKALAARTSKIPKI